MQVDNLVPIDTASTTATPDSRLIIRPSRAHATAYARADRGWRIALTLAFAASGLAFGLRSGVWWLIGAVAAGTAALLAYLALYFHNVAIFAEATRFGKVSVLGRVRSYPTNRLARIVVTRVSYAFAPKPGRPEMYFLDGSGKVLMAVKGSGWKPEDLSRLWRHLRVEPEGSFEQPESLRHLHRTVRVPWVRRNSGLVAIAVMLVFVFGLTLLLSHLGIHLRR